MSLLDAVLARFGLVRMSHYEFMCQEYKKLMLNEDQL